MGDRYDPNDNEESTACCDECGGLHDGPEHEPWGAEDEGQK